MQSLSDVAGGSLRVRARVRPQIRAPDCRRIRTSVRRRIRTLDRARVRAADRAQVRAPDRARKRAPDPPRIWPRLSPPRPFGPGFRAGGAVILEEWTKSEARIQRLEVRVRNRRGSYHKDTKTRRRLRRNQSSEFRNQNAEPRRRMGIHHQDKKAQMVRDRQGQKLECRVEDERGERADRDTHRTMAIRPAGPAGWCPVIHADGW